MKWIPLSCLPALLLLAAQEVPVEEARSIDLVVSSDWLATNLREPDLVVVHVGAREAGVDGGLRSRYADAHVPGARHLPWRDLVTDREGLPTEMPKMEALTRTIRALGIDRTHRIVLYDTGAGLEASRAYVTFDLLGLGDRTALLDGHWKEWTADCRPITRKVPDVGVSTFVARPRPSVLIHWSTLRSQMDTGAPYGVPIALFDARPMTEYAGDRAGKGVARPGHIPYAESVPWDEAIETPDRPVYRPREELERLFAVYGARPGCTVVTYCRTGVKASHLYVTAKMLGYRVRLYDGSYVEWSSMDELPIIDGVWAE